MRGVIRPSHRSLSAPLRERWRAHLCGLCLSLRDESGQAARVLTGYDVLLPSVLVEAQSGPLERTGAGPCPLRGMRTASVIAPSEPAMALAGGAALLAGAASLEDKVIDGDLPRPLRRPARRLAVRARRDGHRLAARSSLDPRALDGAALAARAVEGRPGEPLVALLAPSGRAVASLFSASADVAGRPENREPLAVAGDAFGRLVHLLDAVDDLDADRRAGRFNPLVATGTSTGDAERLAAELHEQVSASLAAVRLADPELVDALFGPVLAENIGRAFGHAPRCAHHAGAHSARRRAVRSVGPLRVRRSVTDADDPVAGEAPTRGGRVGALLTLPLLLASWIGGRRSRRGQPWGYPGGMPGPYGGYPYGRGYRRGCGGPSCCECLACDCIANSCCGDDCCVCCC